MMSQYVKFLNLPQRYALALLSPAIFSHPNIKNLIKYKEFNKKMYTNVHDIVFYNKLHIYDETNFISTRNATNTYFRLTDLSISMVSLSAESLFLLMSPNIQNLFMSEVEVTPKVLFSNIISQIPKVEHITLTFTDIERDTD